MDNFLTTFIQLLAKATESQKDAWILNQAMNLPECKRKSFLKSWCDTMAEPPIEEINESADDSLQAAWTKISGLLFDLQLYPYIDDQYEIQEIWNIVDALINRGGFETEPWEIKEQILMQIYNNYYYDEYGVYDPMYDLANVICVNRQENLRRAELMMNTANSYLGSQAAKLYRELGEEDKCAEYFENHLGKNEEAYEILIDYYRERDYEKAVEIARQAIQKCQKNQTGFFIFLLHDAKNKGDEDTFQKLMKSAHRRYAVNSAKIDAIFIQDARACHH